MRYLSIFLITIFLSSCATRPPMSIPQRRSLQMRTFSHSLDNVFKAFKSVLQDDGYIIKNQDYAGGMLLAQKETSYGGGTLIDIAGVFGDVSVRQNQNRVIGKGYEVSISFDAINKNLIETRLTLQQITSMSQGGKRGREVVDAKMYKAIYDRVLIEIQRRKARGR